MDNTFSLILIAGMVVLVIISLYWHFSRSKSLLEQWADDNGFELLWSEYRTFRRGPFFWTTSKGQSVYRVEVHDRLGALRKLVVGVVERPGRGAMGRRGSRSTSLNPASHISEFPQKL